MLATTFRSVLRQGRMAYRPLSTLANNEHIKVLENPDSPFSHVLSYLETEPPSARLAIGTTTQIPPTPQSFTENPEFLTILNEVVKEHGHQDEDLKSQAQAFASPGAFSLGPGGTTFFAAKRPNRSRNRRQSAAASEENAKEEAASAGRGGWVHLSDRRNPPDFGRIAWPEDILGSVEVDDTGTIVGKVQPSGTYRVVTNQGLLGLSPFLRGKLIERLKKEEAGSRHG